MTGAGERDRLIRIEQGTKAQDPNSGEETISPGTDFFEVWAQVRQPNGSEAFRAQQMVAKVDSIFNIRWRADVTSAETFSILYAGRRYDITAVVEPVNTPRRSELDLYAFARAE